MAQPRLAATVRDHIGEALHKGARALIDTKAFARDRDGSTYVAPQALVNVDHSMRSEEHTSELQSLAYLVCRLLLEKKKKNKTKCDPQIQQINTNRSNLYLNVSLKHRTPH